MAIACKKKIEKFELVLFEITTEVLQWLSLEFEVIFEVLRWLSLIFFNNQFG